jgi:hypothetical protein
MGIEHIHKLLLRNWDNPEWKPYIGKAKKTLGWKGILDVGQIHDMAEAIYKETSSFREIYSLIDE